MNFQHFEGMGAAAGVVLIILIIAWLGLWGPVNLDAVKGWQTLIAGCLAIVAACIAYWGSSSQARLNARIHNEERDRRRLALFLKMEFACTTLRERASNVDAILSFFPKDIDIEYAKSDISIAEPPEIEESWTYLDIFPREIIGEIRIVRNSLRQGAQRLAIMPDEARVWRLGQRDPGFHLERIRMDASNIRDAAGAISRTLDPIIRKLAPEMNQLDKYHLIYGKPDIVDL